MVRQRIKWARLIKELYYIWRRLEREREKSITSTLLRWGRSIKDNFRNWLWLEKIHRNKNLSSFLTDAAIIYYFSQFWSKWHQIYCTTGNLSKTVQIVSEGVNCLKVRVTYVFNTCIKVDPVYRAMEPIFSNKIKKEV